MTLEESLRLLAEQDPELSQAIGPFTSLEEVLRWCATVGASVADIEVVPQDEFSHDVVLALDGGRRYLAVGVT